jgi:hypothetical protein
MAAITIPAEWITYQGHAFSAVAGAAINEPFACVKISGTGVIQTSDATDGIGFIKYETGYTYNAAISVAQVASGTTVSVFTSGIVWAVAGAAITAGDKLKSAAGGQVVTHTTGVEVVGVALTAAAAQHELIAVLVSIGTAA